MGVCMKIAESPLSPTGRGLGRGGRFAVKKICCRQEPRVRKTALASGFPRSRE